MTSARAQRLAYGFYPPIAECTMKHPFVPAVGGETKTTADPLRGWQQERQRQ